MIRGLITQRIAIAALAVAVLALVWYGLFGGVPQTDDWAVAGLAGTQERVASFPELVKLSQRAVRPAADLPDGFFQIAAVEGEVVTPSVERQKMLAGEALAPRAPGRIVADLSAKTQRTAAENDALVEAYLDLAQPDAAIAVRQAAAEAEPSDAANREALLDLLEEQNRVAAWLGELDGYLDNVLARGASLTEAKERDAAIRQAERLIERREAMTRRALLPAADTDALQLKIIDAFPRTLRLLDRYARSLRERELCATAVATVEPRLDRYEGNTILWRHLAACYEKDGRLVALVGRLDAAIVEPDDERLSLWVELTQRAEVVEARREALAEAMVGQPTILTLAKLTAIERGRGESEAARQAYDQYAPGIAAQAVPADLLALATVARRVGRYEEVGSLIVDAAILGGDQDPKLWVGAAHALAGVGAGAMPLAGSDTAGLARRFVDDGPGLVGGLLSLGANGMSTGDAAKSLPRVGANLAAYRQAALLADRALAATTEFDVAFSAANLKERIFYETDQADRLDKLATAMWQRFGASEPEAVKVLLWRAEAARLRKDKDARIAALREVIRQAFDRNQLIVAEEAEAQLESMLLNLKRFPEVVALKWQRVERFPGDEDAMRELLTFAARYKLFDDTERAYKLAIKRFDERTWGDKFARWLLRKKRRDDFEALVTDLAGRLGEGDLAQFVGEHVRWSSSKNASNMFFEKVHTIAVGRFPANVGMSKRLLDFYEYQGFRRRQVKAEYQDKFIDLGLRIFALDQDVTGRVLARLAQRDMLAGAIAKLEEKNELLSAEAYLWTRAQQYLARPEAARRGYLGLADIWPRQERTAGRLATVSRSLADSFYVRDPQLYQAAAEQYARLAERRPLDTAPQTLAGEAWTEAGRPREAARAWETLIAAAPGERERWLELATLYWDYYLPDQAKHTLRDARLRLQEPDLYAKEMAYLLEDEGKVDEAVAELVKVVLAGAAWTVDYREATARLAYLVRKPKTTSAKVNKAIWARLRRADRRGSEGVAYVDYLRRRGRIEPAKRAAYDLLPLYKTTDFANEAYSFFAQYGDDRGVKAALDRLVAVSDRDPQMLRRLAEYHENRGELGQADALVEEVAARAEEYFERRIAWRTAGRYYQRTGRTNKALAFHRRVAENTSTNEAVGDWIRFARYATDAKRFDEAMDVLNKLRADDPTDIQIVSAVAEVFTARGDRPALVNLYDDTLQRLAKLDIESWRKREREIGLREKLIVELTALSQTREAIEHHIQIINRLAPNLDPARRAIAYARRHGQTAPLLAYYEREAKRAHRDFRWQQVAALIRETQGDYPEAAALLEKAVANEPQRVELVERLARVLVKAGDFDGAVKAYRELDSRRLTGDDYQLRIAEVLYLAGRPEEAEAFLAEALAPANAAYSRLIAAADLAGRFSRAVTSRVYANRAIERLLADPARLQANRAVLGRWLRSELDATGAAASLERLTAVLDDLQKKRQAAHPLSKNGIDRNIGAFDKLADNELADWLGDRATAAEREAARQPLRQWCDNRLQRADVKHRGTEFRRVIVQARRAGLAELAEQLESESLLFADSRSRGNKTPVSDLLAGRQASQAWQGLRADLNQLPLARREEFPSLMAWEAKVARATGDVARERAALRTWFEFSSDRDFKVRRPQPLTARYLSLLSPAELDALLPIGGPRRGELVAWLAEQGDTGRTVQALEALRNKRDDTWVNVAQTLVYQHDLSYAKQAEDGYAALLGLPLVVSEQLGDGPGRGLLSGRTWTHYAHRYGAWLAAEKPDRGMRFLYARPERFPLTFAAYRRVAEALDAASRHDDAGDFLERGARFTDRRTLLIEQAAHLQRRGDTRRAAKVLAGLIDEPTPRLYRVRQYAEQMEKIGRAKQGVERWAEELADRLPRMGVYERRDEIAGLIAFARRTTGDDDASDTASRLTAITSRLLESEVLDANDLRSLAEQDATPAALKLQLWAMALERIADDPRASIHAKATLAEQALAEGLSVGREPVCRAALALAKATDESGFERRPMRLQRAEYLLKFKGRRQAEELAVTWATKSDDLHLARGLAARFDKYGHRESADRVWLAYFDPRADGFADSVAWDKDDDPTLEALAAYVRQNHKDAAAALLVRLEEIAGENAGELAVLARKLASVFSDDAVRVAQRAVAFGPGSRAANEAGVLAYLAAGQEREAAGLLRRGWGDGLYDQAQLGALLTEAAEAARGDAWAEASAGLPKPLRELARAQWEIVAGKASAALATLGKLAEPLRYPKLVWTWRGAAARLAGDAAREHEAIIQALRYEPFERRHPALRLGWLELRDTPYAGLLRLAAAGGPFDPSRLVDPLEPLDWASGKLDDFWGALEYQEHEPIALAIIDALVALDAPAEAAHVAATAVELLGEGASRTLRKRAAKLAAEVAERQAARPVRFVPSNNLEM
jgi:Tetratricopeptide repeat